jgi:ABC-type uncharacterized transport system auxiliary subunit
MKIPSVKLPFALLATSLLLSACGPLIKIGDGSPPPALYSIQPTISGNLSNEGLVIYVSEPLLPGESIGNRIAVRTDDFELKFLKDGRWSEPFRMMLHRYFVGDLAGSVKAQVVGAGLLDISADCRLTVDFQRFDYETQSNSVVAKATARFVSLKSGSLLSSKVINISADVSSDKSDKIVSGYNQAASKVSTALSEWLKDALPACAAVE